MTISQKQLIKNIKAEMNDIILLRDEMRRYIILSGEEQGELKNPAKVAELYDAEYRWHANTIVILLARDKKTPTAELIRRRTDIARQILEITEELVQSGDIPEQEYLEDCKYYSEELQNLL